MKRHALVSFALLLLLSPSGGGARGAAPVPDLSWRPCGDGFECAMAQVPLDHDRPRGPRIGIALIRKPAPDRANRIGSLFVNPGGPGGSGIEFLRTAPPGALEVLHRFDVIGFDPRGRGDSRPAISDCGADPALQRPLPRPANTDHREFAAAARAYGKRCLRENRALLRHLSSANVARDLDLLRAAVGDAKLNYIGISYGGVIGATYASLFPGRARAMLLDSPIDVGGYYRRPLTQWGEYAQGHEDTLRRFLAACDANASCGFGGGDARGAFDRLLAQLDRSPIAPVTPQAPHGVTGDHVRMALEYDLRSPQRWPALAAGLREAAAGDGKRLHDVRFGPDAQDFGPDAFMTGVLAVDQQFPRMPLRRYFGSAERAYADFPNFWFTTGYWNVVHTLWSARDRDAFRGRIRNPSDAAPILVVGITHDPATPYVQQQRLVADLGNARLLTLDGDGHGALTSFDGCVLGHAIAYLEMLALPAEGTTCVQQGGFFPAATTAK
jgi:pimeloyl-ACP methyl ester carboxylesterase